MKKLIIAVVCLLVAAMLTLTTATATPASAANAVAAAPVAHTNTTLPIRAGFFYPWYPESWPSPAPHYTPTLGAPYNQDDPSVQATQVNELNYGKFNAAISSWWGQGHYTDTRFGSYLSASHGTNLKWAPYYEAEGNSISTTPGSPNPSSSQITSDLNYIYNHYAADPNYLWVNDKPVIFAYADGSDNCGMVDRWTAANAAATQPFYLVLKVFGGYSTCTNQPDNWHQYGPASREDVQGSHSISISPGYWKYNSSTATLARDTAAWSTAVNDMNCSNADFKLVTTFNEDGEGSEVEPTTSWQSASGNGTYLDTLHNNTVCGGGTGQTNQSPTAAFSITKIVNNHIYVDGSASSDPDGNVVKWDWNWGTTATHGSGAVTDHGYVNPGTYNVTLTVTDDQGATSSVTHTVTVPQTTGNQSPTAAFTSSVSGGNNVSVDGSGSSDPDGNVVTWDWDWGSGAPHGSGATATHTYTQSGTYNVTLTVTDNNGATSSVTHPVTVTVPQQGPTAAFTYSVSGHTVSVDGSGSTGTGLTYDWNWGSTAAHGSGVTTSHGYVNPGTYTITLTVTDNTGATSSVSHDVTIAGSTNSPPTAAFTTSVSGNTVSVNGSGSSDSDGNVATYDWNFGDGSAHGSGVTASHTYASSGTYTVTLTVTDNSGATGTATHSVTIGSTPPPPSGHKVMVIVGENHSYNETISGMPYLTGLGNTYGHATAYHAIGHPSLPNYMEFSGGTNAGITSDCGVGSGCQSTAPSVFDQTIGAGKTAKLYAESMTSNCQTGGSGNYAPRHAEWVYYTSATSRANCQANQVPMGTTTSGNLLNDINNGNLPITGQMTPNLCNDAHDCSLATFDNWLKTWMPKLMNGPDYKAGNLTIIVTFDEDDSSQSNTVPFDVIDPRLSGKTVTGSFNHYSLTRWWEDNAGVSHLANAASAADLRAAFGL